MRSRVASVVELPSPRAAEGETLETLADRLMQQARDQAGVPGGGPRVLLDVESDGIRCMLLCTEQRKRDAPVLSPREQEIARLVARGFPNKAIAALLDISTWTVGTYLRRMFAKLGVTARAAMIAKLMEHRGLTDRD